MPPELVRQLVPASPRIASESTGPRGTAPTGGHARCAGQLNRLRSHQERAGMSNARG
jgi:hypothetical protein